VKEGVNENAVLIPQQAVSRDPKGNPMALIVDAADKVEQRMLKLDRAIGDQWFVIAGLAAGDRLIVEGMQKVRPGAVVKAVPFDGGLKNKPESEKTAQPAQKSK
jgi:membrane fusion protein (multidrug efflux system)